MSQNLSSPPPLQPLTVGNVVSAGFRLYRSHLQSYFLLALKASLWSLLPALILVPVVIVITLNARSGSNSPIAWTLVILMGLALFLYGLGQALVYSSTISRLAFSELVNQPETVADAHARISPKLWTFVRTVLYLILIWFGIFIGFGIFMVIPLLNLLAFIPLLIFFVWLAARLFLAEVPLAIEENLDARSTIGRSWDLSKGNAWRLVLILIVAFLITVPIQIVVQFISTALQQGILQPAVKEAANGSTNAMAVVAIAYLVTLGLSLLVNAVVLPFWQAIKAVIYYDLRSRREGLGLKLRDRRM
jgi:hypothetical protein